ncbi:hypothetical protein BJY04DRAFT_175402 [Aspergillus karnatakaensis]|uniref:uncharacterized protein n=1 Tax=Aspergillus karnatakaensis TaxID=1810916 RepID=UPI003CCCDC9C
MLSLYLLILPLCYTAVQAQLPTCAGIGSLYRAFDDDGNFLDICNCPPSLWGSSRKRSDANLDHRPREVAHTLKSQRRSPRDLDCVWEVSVFQPRRKTCRSQRDVGLQGCCLRRDISAILNMPGLHFV